MEEREESPLYEQVQYRSRPAQTAPSRTPSELITMMVSRMGSSVYSQALSLSFSDTSVTEDGSMLEDGVEKEDGQPEKTESGENTRNLGKKTFTHNKNLEAKVSVHLGSFATNFQFHWAILTHGCGLI